MAPHATEVTHTGVSNDRGRGRNTVLETGDRVVQLCIPGLEGEQVWTSRDAVNAPFVPGSMLILGAGAVGVEFSFVFNALGSHVTVVEMMPQILPTFDEEVAKEAERALSKQGIQFITSSTLKSAERVGDRWRCHVETPNGMQQIEVQVVLIGVGRKPNVDGIGLETVGVQMNKRYVAVDEHMRTNIPHIYAIGDITGIAPLAHVARAQGIVAAAHCFGAGRTVDDRAVPHGVYAGPAVAGGRAAERGTCGGGGRARRGGHGGRRRQGRGDPRRPHLLRARQRPAARGGACHQTGSDARRAGGHHPPAPDDGGGADGSVPRRGGTLHPQGVAHASEC